MSISTSKLSQGFILLVMVIASPLSMPLPFIIVKILHKLFTVYFSYANCSISCSSASAISGGLFHDCVLITYMLESD